MMQALYLKRRDLVTGVETDHDTHIQTIVVINHSDAFSFVCFGYSAVNTTKTDREIQQNNYYKTIFEILRPTPSSNEPINT